MSAAARSKRIKSRGSDSELSGKGDGFQLHDEADLINFRADAYARFINNQDYLENVALKPFHTSQIAPPLSFPIPEKKYKDTDDDEELQKVLEDQKPDLLYFGDLKLMRLREKLLAAEVEELQKEVLTQSADTVFSEESRFQHRATTTLAKLYAECNDIESIEKLEKEMELIISENEEKFQKNYVLQQAPYKKYSIAASDISPDLEVQTAPPLYNPRLIMSFINMSENENGSNGIDFHGENAIIDPTKLGPFPYAQNGSGGDDFAMLEKGATNGRSATYDGRYNGGNNYTTPYNAAYAQSGSNYAGSQAAAPSSSAYAQNSSGFTQSSDFESTRPTPPPAAAVPEPAAEADVNMDDLNQFLESNGNDDIVGDDMDALMNFDQDQDAGIMDDEFGQDFLMDHAME